MAPRILWIRTAAVLLGCSGTATCATYRPPRDDWTGCDRPVLIVQNNTGRQLVIYRLEEPGRSWYQKEDIAEALPGRHVIPVDVTEGLYMAGHQDGTVMNHDEAQRVELLKKCDSSGEKN